MISSNSQPGAKPRLNSAKRDTITLYQPKNRQSSLSVKRNNSNSLTNRPLVNQMQKNQGLAQLNLLKLNIQAKQLVIAQTMQLQQKPDIPRPQVILPSIQGQTRVIAGRIDSARSKKGSLNASIGKITGVGSKPSPSRDKTIEVKQVKVTESALSHSQKVPHEILHGSSFNNRVTSSPQPQSRAYHSSPGRPPIQAKKLINSKSNILEESPFNPATGDNDFTPWDQTIKKNKSSVSIFYKKVDCLER